MRFKISRFFWAALLGAGAMVVQHPKDANVWVTAVTAVLAAASGGATTKRTDED